MPTVVSTGQITIVDTNDARPITAFITGSGPLQQIYSKDESAESWVPNWASTPLVLSARVYVGGANAASEVTAQLSNRKWSTDLSTSLGNGTTYTINSNVLTSGVPSRVYYFEGDYTDPATSLVTHVIAQVTISQVKTGTNAVYIQVNGQTVIEQSTGSTKNFVTLWADLVRASGIDDTGVTYKWFAAPFAVADQIDGNYPSVTTKFGFLDTAAQNTAAVTGAIGVVKKTSSGTTSTLNTTAVPDGAWADLKGIVIGEAAVNNIGMFMVQAKDTDGTIYQQYFTVWDVSDTYDVRLASSSGDKLQNGVGSTTITPTVFYGGVKVTNLTGWIFDWYFYDRNGNRAAFVDTAKISTAGGAPITANTTGASAQFTYSGASFAFTAGMIIKAVKPNGDASYYEVASAGTNTVTIRTPTSNTWLNFTNFPAPSASGDFVGGVLYGCVNGGVRITNGASSITVTGDEIDVKGTIVCEAERP